MTVKVRIPRPFLQPARPKAVAPAPEPEPAPEVRPFKSMLRECATQDLSALKHQRIQRIPPPSPVQLKKVTAAGGPGLLRRTFGWLQRKYAHANTKQLRVAETVSLGEKRFVAIIHADGQKYLIGGGSAGVALLTQLGDVQTENEAGAQILGFTEQTA